MHGEFREALEINKAFLKKGQTSIPNQRGHNFELLRNCFLDFKSFGGMISGQTPLFFFQASLKGSLIKVFNNSFESN